MVCSKSRYCSGSSFGKVSCARSWSPLGHYDIYSSVHYGYAGRAAGFDADTLIKGASLGETLLTWDDDQGDQITMRVGIELYNKYGDNLTEEQLRQGISAAMDQMEQAQRNGENVPQVRSRNWHGDSGVARSLPWPVWRLVCSGRCCWQLPGGRAT
ncbi:polymorphic toxin type 44 domain-containing protein [Streptomyces sp. WAC07061]|uniref:polymorphic toxin type 44 domain-containing protein n=1 Tax=Streptomyces sp. WAC07061 TaxID=2487410 RepID=UPI0021B08036|nr:polymorphic toxin type 44 domain-containing protein [Streptomyces sp. WAC07061]